MVCVPILEIERHSSPLQSTGGTHPNRAFRESSELHANLSCPNILRLYDSG
jgi:hypothetical protein